MREQSLYDLTMMGDGEILAEKTVRTFNTWRCRSQATWGLDKRPSQVNPIHSIYQEVA